MRRAALPLIAFLALGALPACEKIPNVPPTASFIFSPVAPINAGQTAVVFNASASRDSDGRIVSYVWNFGDGTPDQATAGATTAHVFPDTAATCATITYAVLLTTVDDAGEQGTAAQNLTVTELPAPSSLACQAPR